MSERTGSSAPLPSLSRAEAQRVAERCAQILREQFGATRVAVFGSVKEGEPWRADPDLDLAVEGIPPESFFRAWAALESVAPPGLKIDLVDLADAGPELRARILGETPMPSDPLERLAHLIEDELATSKTNWLRSSVSPLRYRAFRPLSRIRPGSWSFRPWHPICTNTIQASRASWSACWTGAASRSRPAVTGMPTCSTRSPSRAKVNARPSWIARSMLAWRPIGVSDTSSGTPTAMNSTGARWRRKQQASPRLWLNCECRCGPSWTSWREAEPERQST